MGTTFDFCTTMRYVSTDLLRLRTWLSLEADGMERALEVGREPRRPRLAAALAGFAVLLLGCAARADDELPDDADMERAAGAEHYAITEGPAPNARGTAIRFELRAGDCATVRDCLTGRERAEVSEDWRAPLGSDVRYVFKLFMPEDYPEASPKQILGQWHAGGHPVLSNRYEQGRFWFDLMTEPGVTTRRFPLRRFTKGRWHWFTYEVRWTHAAYGWLRVWYDRELVVDYRGPTLIEGATTGPLFKFGLYRSDAGMVEGPSPTQVVYFDEYNWKRQKKK
jgi:hypothetical protein